MPWERSTTCFPPGDASVGEECDEDLQGEHGTQEERQGAEQAAPPIRDGIELHEEARRGRQAEYGTDPEEGSFLAAGKYRDRRGEQGDDKPLPCQRDGEGTAFRHFSPALWANICSVIHGEKLNAPPIGCQFAGGRPGKRSAGAAGQRWREGPKPVVTLWPVRASARRRRTPVRTSAYPAPSEDAAAPASPGKPAWRPAAAAATFPEAVRENEEVVPVNAVSTWVLSSGVTVGR